MSRIFGSVCYLSPVNRTAAICIAPSESVRGVSVRDDAGNEKFKSEGARVTALLGQCGITRKSSLYELHQRVMSVDAHPAFYMFRIAEGEYSIGVRHNKMKMAFADWARQYGFVCVRDRGDKFEVLLAIDRLRKMSNLPCPVRRTGRKAASARNIWKRESRRLNVILD